uniref:Uncharacterized protein n=1 Tax=Cacopsylla melanoneura TaxID=428564 RepID=A0A8D8WLM7_9HEMI
MYKYYKTLKSIYLYLQSGDWLTISLHLSLHVFSPCLQFDVVVAASIFHYLFDVAHPGSSSSLCSFSPSFNDINYKCIVSVNMSYPSMSSFLNLFPYLSFFIHHFQHSLITHTFCPLDLLHPSPAPHLKRFNSLFIILAHRPSLCSV